MFEGRRRMFGRRTWWSGASTGVDGDLFDGGLR